MKSLASLVVYSLLCTPSLAGEGGHFEAPGEEDVVNPTKPCVTNADGFGGTLTQDFVTIEYHYEMQYLKDGKDVTQIIESVEKDGADFLLASDLFNLDCANNARTLRRRLEAVGITANPDDELMEGIACSEIEMADDDTTECAVVSASFQVFYTGDNVNEDQLEKTFEDAATNGINAGSVKFTDPDIVQVVAVKAPSGANGNDGAEANGDSIQPAGEDPASQTPVIIGATVGALLILGAVGLYRRKKNAENDDTTFTPDQNKEPKAPPAQSA